MNNKVLTRILFIFFGGLLFAFTFKSVMSLYVKHFSDEFNLNNVLDSIEKEYDNKSVYFPLKEQYGFTLNDTESCAQEKTSLLTDQTYNLNSNCWNDSCSINIKFLETIPQNISLALLKNGKCVVEEVKVPKSLDTVGYFVDLKLTQKQQDKLSILNQNKVRLSEATGYSLNSKEHLYFYETKLLQDEILVDGKNKGTIYFSKQGDDEVETSEKIEIPHPTELYTFRCNSDRRCEIEANTYIVNLNGVDFIPNDEFIMNCLGGDSTSKYCSSMTKIGKVRTITFNSNSVMNSYIKESLNPEFDDSLETWEKERFMKAKEELMQNMY